MSDKSWERPLSTQEIVDNATNWSLAADVGLLKHLEQFSEDVLAKADKTNDNLNNLLQNLSNASLSLDIARNEFLSLSNTQFIESRVYEDDEILLSQLQEAKNEVVKERKQTEEDRLNDMKKALKTGLNVIDRYFDKVELLASDSEDETDLPSFVLRPKDPYIDRPLPYVIGSEEWHRKWHVGLQESSSDSETEKVDNYSDTDSNSDLPVTNRSQGKNISESGSDADLSNKINMEQPVANSTFNDTRKHDMLGSSGSEEFSSVSAQAPISQNNFAEQLAAKLGSVAQQNTEVSEPEINKRPIQKPSMTSDFGFLSDEPPPLDDDDDLFNTKEQQGIFSGNDNLFDDLDDDVSFWGEKKDTKKPQQGKDNNSSSKDVKSKIDARLKNDNSSEYFKDAENKKNGGFFDDYLSDDELFGTSNLKKQQVNRPYLPPLESHHPFIDDQPPELVHPNSIASDSLPEEKPKGKTPIGGKLVFGKAIDGLIKNRRKYSSESSDNDNVATYENDVPKENALDKSRKPDGAVNQTEISKTKISSNASKGSNDVTSKPEPRPRNNTSKPEPKERPSIDPSSVDDTDDLFAPKKKEEPQRNKSQTEGKQKTQSVFSDDNLLADDLFSNISTKKYEGGLFDDEDDDFFTPKSSSEKSVRPDNLFKDNLTDNSLTKTEGKDFGPDSSFDENVNVGIADNFKNKSLSDEKSNKSLKLFDADIAQEDFLTTTKQPKESGVDSLFSDEDNFDADDLFAKTKTKIQNFKSNLKEKYSEDAPPLKETSTKEENNAKIDKENKNAKGKTDKKVPSLFDDEDDEDDLFSGAIRRNKSRSSSLFSDNSNQNSKNEDMFAPKNLFRNVAQSQAKEQPKSSDTESKTIRTLSEINKSSTQTNEYPKVDGILKSEEMKIETEEKVLPTQQGISEQENSSNTEKLSKSQNQSLGVKIKELTKVDDPVKEKAHAFEGLQSTTELNLKNEEKPLDTTEEKKFKEVNLESKENLHVRVKSDNIVEGVNPVHKIEGNLGSKEYKSHDKQVPVNNNSNQHEDFDDFKFDTPSIQIDSTTVNDNSVFSQSAGSSKLLNINLFDPTPPPDDNWDTRSESNLFDDDLYSFENTGNVTEPRSNIFDNEPPSLLYNESSGIVRDQSARNETSDSSFYPYASSSRRFSADTFHEDQSNDSLFVTKNKSTVDSSNLYNIPELTKTSEEFTANIDITPSGTFDDIYSESATNTTAENIHISTDSKGKTSVDKSKDMQVDNFNVALEEKGNEDGIDKPNKLFETESKDNKKYIKQEGTQNDAVSTNSFAKKAADSTDNIVKPYVPNRKPKMNKKSLSLSEENLQREETIQKSKDGPPGKLKLNLNIPVHALLPGASLPKKNLPVGPPVKPESSNNITVEPKPSKVVLRERTPQKHTETVVEQQSSANDSFLGDVEVLHSVTKSRAKIPFRRKPSTRRGREAFRKSCSDVTLGHGEGAESEDDEDRTAKKVFPKNLSHRHSLIDELVIRNKKNLNDNKTSYEAAIDTDVPDKLSHTKPAGASLQKEFSTLLPNTERATLRETDHLFSSDALVDTEQIMGDSTKQREASGKSPTDFSLGYAKEDKNQIDEDSVPKKEITTKQSHQNSLIAENCAILKETDDLFSSCNENSKVKETSDDIFYDAQDDGLFANLNQMPVTREGSKEIKFNITPVVSEGIASVETDAIINEGTKGSEVNKNSFLDPQDGIPDMCRRASFVKTDNFESSDFKSLDLFDDDDDEDNAGDMFSSKKLPPKSDLLKKSHLFDDDDDNDDDIFGTSISTAGKSHKVADELKAAEKKVKMKNVKKLENTEVSIDPLNALEN